MKIAKFILLAGLLAPDLGCGPSGSAPSDGAMRSDPAAVALLRSADEAPMRRAFEALGALPYQRLSRVEQLGPDGRPVAAAVHDVRFRPGAAPTTVRAETTGVFTRSFFAPASTAEAESRDLVPELLPEELPFLSPRNRDAFRIVLRPDTTFPFGCARVVDVRAVPGEGDGQALRHARFFLDPATRTLVAMHLRRRTADVMLRERGTFGLELQRTAGGAWVPARLHHEGALRLTLGGWHRYRLQHTFRVQPLPSGPGPTTL